MVEGIVGYTHSPWANTFRCYPGLYIKPDSIEKVQNIVNEASERGINIVTTGATHSPSEITATSGWLVNLDKLDSILEIEKHESYTDVTVEAGLRLKDLNEKLALRGLSLQNLGSISEQSIAGVISTGTHGSSYCHGLISEQFVSLDIVVEGGKLVTASELVNRDLFQAALLGLGAFGIIVRAKIRCVPSFNVESRAYVMGFDELLTPEVWNRIFLESEFHRIWWYPYANKCYVWQGEKTDKPQDKALYSFYGTKVGRFLYEFLLWIAVKFKPSWTPWVERWLFSRQFSEGTILRHVGRSDKEINMDCLFKQFVNEWSLPLINGPAALRALRNEILAYKWYVHAPIEIRASNTTLPTDLKDSLAKCVKARPSLGPVYGNVTRPLLDPSPKLPYAHLNEITNEQLTLNLNATMFRPFRCDPPVKEWYSMFESICAKNGGKPHWAKIFVNNPWTEPENQDDVRQWIQAKHQWSPKNIFGSTNWLKEKGLY